jgi:hypothetical protein
MPVMEKGYPVGIGLHLFIVYLKTAYDTVKRKHLYKKFQGIWIPEKARRYQEKREVQSDG